MFTRILIANRGEIACRIIRTARRLGIGTVAVFSEADREALHVHMADEAWAIGPAPASESYLNGAAIIAAARASGAEAIHPGYGFLSENPDFAEAVEAAGLVFIGPSAKAIRAMGHKDAAKVLMEKAKVPVVPGYHGAAQELVVLAGKASEIGFPVLIKARAGGGGKGLRRVDHQSDFADALSAAKREAKAAFGDDHVLVEKLIASPRHIEIQVFGDHHGNVVHLFERDCSLQRRHQKVVEEAPAPGMGSDMRAAMGATAVKAAKAIGYSGAGTVEFIADASEGLRPERFWFMEMNTRLQVEHPVTEAITGLDLVELQLRVAAGDELPFAQSDLAIEGHAVEARLYAEDAEKGFLPAIGQIDELVLPEAIARVDTGVAAGDQITPHYDPMIAKIITHGKTRKEALAVMRAALNQTRVGGLITNTVFLKRLLCDRDVNAGRLDTGLIERAFSGMSLAAPYDPELAALAAIEIIMAGSAVTGGSHDHSAFAQLGPWCHWGWPRRSVSLVCLGVERHVVLQRTGAREWLALFDDGEPGKHPDGMAPPRDSILLRVMPGRHVGERLIERLDPDGGRRRTVLVANRPGCVVITAQATTHVFDLTSERAETDADPASGDSVIAPMPGIIKEVLTRQGASVRAGQPLIIMEAMKMEMTLAAPRDGEVCDLFAQAGRQVEDGTMLVLLKAQE